MIVRTGTFEELEAVPDQVSLLECTTPSLSLRRDPGAANMAPACMCPNCLHQLAHRRSGLSASGCVAFDL